jgi:transcriptional regulator with XRE-family HTH domain
VGRPQREVDPFRDELQVFRKALGSRIRDLRTLRGWSQEEFAAKAHVHRTFAGSLERGEKNCSFHALVLIAQCFGITLSEMLAGLETGETPESNTAKQLQRRSAHGNRGDMDRKRLLEEVLVLEQAARTLKEIARPQKEHRQSSLRERKPRQRSAGSKGRNGAFVELRTKDRG